MPQAGQEQEQTERDADRQRLEALAALAKLVEKQHG